MRKIRSRAGPQRETPVCSGQRGSERQARVRERRARQGPGTASRATNRGEALHIACCLSARLNRQSAFRREELHDPTSDVMALALSLLPRLGDNVPTLMTSKCFCRPSTVQPTSSGWASSTNWSFKSRAENSGPAHVNLNQSAAAAFPRRPATV